MNPLNRRDEDAEEDRFYSAPLTEEDRYTRAHLLVNLGVLIVLAIFMVALRWWAC